MAGRVAVAQSAPIDSANSVLRVWRKPMIAVRDFVKEIDFERQFVIQKAY
jgi:hypothetical protein